MEANSHPADLAAAHAELRRLIDAIEAETARPLPDIAGLTSVRMKLTQASRRRTALVDEIVRRNRVAASAEQRAHLETLWTDLQQARMISAGHIGRWTVQAIKADWPGYCAASADLRIRMRAQIDREAALLA
ncbi:hypothetical protein [Sphingomonas sp. ID0503]|uniref:hypothetical protein n=1 Tax=Sphingomonas sp. ID0503 TaxID=3399691 RepID=UPI003AFA7BBC